MFRKEIDGQEAAIWALSALFSVGLLVTLIAQDQSAKSPGCIQATELKRGAIVINVEVPYTVCKD
jgi:hypothetical protein